jgi:hypothetical protein
MSRVTLSEALEFVENESNAYDLSTICAQMYDTINEIEMFGERDPMVKEAILKHLNSAVELLRDF